MDSTHWMGDAIKALDDSGRVGGYLVRFGDPAQTDLIGDYFTKDTDFVVEEWPAKTAVYYDHGFDEILKRRKLATGEMTIDDVGIWVEAQLGLRDKYERAILRMVKAGQMGWSSSTAPHLMEKEGGRKASRVVRWPLGLDASITPTPAEWRNGAVSLKSMIDEFDEPLEADAPEDTAATVSAHAGGVEDNAVPAVETDPEEGNNTMDTDNSAVVDNGSAPVDVAALAAEVKSLRALLDSEPARNKIEAPMLNLKSMRGDTETKAFNYYLRTGDGGALKAYNNTDMNIGTDADGGYVVPTEQSQFIVARRDELMLAPKLGVRKIPGKGLTVNVPIDGEADVLFTSVGEASTIAQDAPALGEKAFTLVKYAKFITLSWELLNDETADLTGYLGDWIGRGVAATHNNLLITEALANGTAGLTLDAAAAIGAGEIPELEGKLMPEYQDGAAWIMHPTTYAYLRGLYGTSQFTFNPGGQGTEPGFGYPVHRSSYATALAASAKSLIFGNFGFMGYRESPGLTVLRDPYSVASAGQVKLWYYFRTVYGVLQAEAIQYATHPSA